MFEGACVQTTPAVRQSIHGLVNPEVSLTERSV